MRLGPEGLSALSRLSNNIDGKIVVEWLESRLADLRANDGIKDEVFARWNQGARIELADILDTIKTAGAKLDKIREARG